MKPFDSGLERGEPQEPSLPGAVAQGREAHLPNGAHWADIEVKGQRYRLRWIEPGTFTMGDESWNDNPAHEVTLTQGFWIGATPVTRAFYQAVMGEDPSDDFNGASGPDHPVQRVSRQDCQQFCNRLMAQVTGLQAWLPSDAQWEYAARAGTRSHYWWGRVMDPTLCNFNGLGADSDFPKGCGHTTRVEQYPPNPWGLVDVHGNVWEWCEDVYTDLSTRAQSDPLVTAGGSLRVLRGGSWNDCAGDCRSAYRDLNLPGARSHDGGLRFAAGPSASG